MNMPKPQQIKLQETKELLYRHAEEITKDAAHWMNFLDTAARLYRYRFSDVVLIHAQKPEARSVAAYNVWSQNMHRYIKRGTKGIALIDDLWSDPHMRYVYDIADTGMTRLSRSPANWEITEEIEEDMRQHMIATYGLQGYPADTYERSLLATSFTVCEDKWKDILDVMYNREAVSENSSLMNNFQEDMLDGQIASLLTNSLLYILMRRSGIDPMRILSENDFTPWLKGFENFEFLDAVGNVMMEQAGLILHDIYRTTVQIANEKVKNTVDTINKESYTTINKTMRSSEVLRSAIKTPAAFSEGQTAEYNGNGGQEHGHSIHSQGGLSVSESDRNAGSGRERGDRKIRDNAYGVSSGASVRDLPEPSVHGGSQETLREGERRGNGADGVSHGGADGTLQGSGARSDDGPLELHGMEEQYREDDRGDRPGGLGVHVVEENPELEEDNLIPEEPDEIPPGLSLPDLPSMQEQMRELQKLEDATFATESSVPVEVIDEFLRNGGPERNSNLRIIYNFMIGQADEDYAEFLYREFAVYSQGHFEGYRGLQMDGIPYTEGWSEEGLVFAAGRNLDGIGKVRLSWREASKRIEQLLLAGQYAPQEVLDTARDNALREHAEILRLFHIDASAEVRECFTHVDRTLFQGNVEEYSVKMQKELKNPVFLKNLLLDLNAIQKYGEKNPEAFHGRARGYWYHPGRMIRLFTKFQKPAIPYQEDPNFKWKYTSLFIPREVLDGELRRGGLTRDGNYRIFSFFLTHKGKKERTDFLKKDLNP